MKKYPRNPQVFFSTDGLGEKTYDSIIAAFFVGYHYFTFSEHDSNFDEVVRAFKEWFINNHEEDREEYFFQARIGIENIDQNQTRNAITRISKSMSFLTYLDCFILERPSLNFELTMKAWYELIVHRDWGVVVNIGVANFDKDQIMLLWKKYNVKPICNLIEFNLRNQRWDRVSWCQNNGIYVQAYGTLNNFSTSKAVKNMSSEIKISIDMLVIGWIINCGISVCIAANKQENIVSNFQAQNVSLQQEEIIKFWKINTFKNKYPETFLNNNIIEMKDELDKN